MIDRASNATAANGTPHSPTPKPEFKMVHSGPGSMPMRLRVEK